MATLNARQIYALARNAGLSPAQAITATAVALAESGGRIQAHNATPPDDSYGLWQINMLGDLGPARRASLGLKANTDLLDPYVNAKAMAQISGGGANWGAWTTYTRGTYRQFLASAASASTVLETAGTNLVTGKSGGWRAELAGIGKPSIVDQAKDKVGAAADAITDPVARAIQGATTDLTAFGIKAAFVLLGLGLAAMGAWRATSGPRQRLADRGAELAGTAAAAAV
jgi:hypothetical protein